MWPVGAMLPQLKDRGTCLGRTSVGIRGTDGARVVGDIDESCNVVCEPTGESVVGLAGIEFGEDTFAEFGDELIWR